METISVLFVCMGNICRSPTAQGVFQRYLREHGIDDRVTVDSAGTHAYHVGEPPDSRAQASAMQRGFDLSSQRARQVVRDDFAKFDYVLAMDRDNLGMLKAICPAGERRKVKLYLEYASKVKRKDVPDPYYGGDEGFDRVLDLVEQAAEGLIREIQARLPA